MMHQIAYPPSTMSRWPAAVLSSATFFFLRPTDGDQLSHYNETIAGDAC